tara:strand:- start:137 stop:379 length:243 start_codon:yes stop_codon:yes gene_type:complete
MIEEGYGFYIDLDDNYANEKKNDNIEKKYNDELDQIDKYENKYLEKLDNLETHHKWTFIEGLQCFWFVVQTIIYRYTKNN